MTIYTETILLCHFVPYSVVAVNSYQKQMYYQFNWPRQLQLHDAVDGDLVECKHVHVV